MLQDGSDFYGAACAAAPVQLWLLLETDVGMLLARGSQYASLSEHHLQQLQNFNQHIKGFLSTGND